MPWTLVAAIGRVESNHGRFGGATLLADGRSNPPIVGIPLDGRPGVALIGDTDGGQYDGDPVHDRAVGPMQFIPGTWALFATDGDHDGKSDPFDIDDAAAAAANYLCRAGGDLSTEAGQRNAVYSYNRSDSYVPLVLALAARVRGRCVRSTAPRRRVGRRGRCRHRDADAAAGQRGPAAGRVADARRRRPRAKPTTPAPTRRRRPSERLADDATPTPTTTTPAPTTTHHHDDPGPTTTTPTPSPRRPARRRRARARARRRPARSARTDAAAAESASAAASAETATPAGTSSATATATPTATPTPTLPTCPTP